MIKYCCNLQIAIRKPCFAIRTQMVIDRHRWKVWGLIQIASTLCRDYDLRLSVATIHLGWLRLVRLHDLSVTRLFEIYVAI